MDKEEDSKAPPSPGKKSFLSDISGGVNNLKKRDTSPAPPKSSGNSMMDAIMAQKSKMAEKRATPSPQSVTPPPQKQNSGGFNTNMLQRAQMKTTAKEDSDSDGDGWSDDGQSEEKQVTKKVQEALKPTPKPTNSNLKATTVKPPEVVKAPPSRPKDLAAEKKLEESKKVAPPPPPPAEKTPEPEKKVLKESVAQAVKNETPPPPPPSDKTKSPLRSATPPPPPASKASGNDKESEKTNAHVPSNEVEELKKRLEIAEKKLSEAGHSSSMLLREAVLEEQLERAHETIVTLKHDKNALKLSIKELQTRLTNAEVHKKNGGDDLKQQTASNVHEAMKRGEREKDLEKQLIKAKKDKDKALKLLIQLIGKERIAEHLQKHAGDGDILDSLIASFGGSCSAPRASNSTSPKKKKFLGSTASKGGSGTMGKPAMRSRSDQYFFENQY